jgi:glucose-6-phosphate isomerase
MRISENLTKEHVERNTSKLQFKTGDFIHYDYSKTHCMEEDKNRLKDELLEKDLNLKIEGMYKGDEINYTEKRPVLHYLLREESLLQEVTRRINDESPPKRDPKKSHKATHQKEEYNSNDNSSKKDGGKSLLNEMDLMDSYRNEITEELVKMNKFTKEFKNLKGITGKSFKHIVNIGIGGSDLGPRMVTNALQFYCQAGREIHFISNIDPSETLKVFKKIEIESTVFVVVSKTFTTVETIENFKFCLKLVKESLINGGGESYPMDLICNKHFIAVSSNLEETGKYGIKTVFKMWDFVGGRYSLWSAVGISIALFIGFENYLKLLQGASLADKDFFENRINSISSKLAINELFYISKGFNNKCIVSYDSYLDLLYKYMQQAEMESNGKASKTTAGGRKGNSMVGNMTADVSFCPKQMIVWGGVGTDVQHSFFQLLHQGNQNIYLELLCPIQNLSGSENKSLENQIKLQHKLLTSACIAQSSSMMTGKPSLDINLNYPGDKPSVTILYSKLTPEILGGILAIYEHKIFVEGVYFEINSFDQFGVQLGKTIANELLDGSKSNLDLDESSKELLSLLN